MKMISESLRLQEIGLIFQNFPGGGPQSCTSVRGYPSYSRLCQLHTPPLHIP